MSAFQIGLTIAGVGVIIVLAVVMRELQCPDCDESSSHSEYDEEDLDGISEEGCRDALLFLMGAALVVVGLLVSAIAWFFSLS